MTDDRRPPMTAPTYPALRALREVLDRTIAAIDDPKAFLHVAECYRDGWLDALAVVRDDPALAAAEAAPLDVELRKAAQAFLGMLDAESEHEGVLRVLLRDSVVATRDFRAALRSPDTETER